MIRRRRRGAAWTVDSLIAGDIDENLFACEISILVPLVNRVHQSIESTLNLCGTMETSSQRPDVK